MSDTLKTLCDSILDELASLTPEEIAAADSKTPPPEGVVLYSADEEIIRLQVLLRRHCDLEELMPIDFFTLPRDASDNDRLKARQELEDCSRRHHVWRAKNDMLSAMLAVKIAGLCQEFQVDPHAKIHWCQGWKMASVVPPPEPARDPEEYLARRTGGMWGAPIR